MSSDGQVGYTEGFIAQVQLLWGEGFISPGGAEEVARAVEGVDLRGKEVLDLGIGLTGPARLLVEAHGAARVAGVDVQHAVLARAAALVREAGLADRIALRHVEPDGALPFADGSFDAVFSKETIVYVADKAALFGEVRRVLRLGGWLLASDWYPGEEEPPPAALEFWRELAGVRAGLAPLAAQAAMLRAAGFVDVAATDRTAWYRKASRRDAERLRTTDRPGLVAALGEEGAEALIERARVTAAMVGRGWLRPGHLRGRRPG
jgi:SAM-dependent methyltransferase